MSGLRALVTIPLLLLVALAVAGCDKCGNRLHLSKPALQHACSGDADEAR